MPPDLGFALGGDLALSDELWIEDEFGGGAWVLVPTRGLYLGGPLYGRGFAGSLLAEYRRIGRENCLDGLWQRNASRRSGLPANRRQVFTGAIGATLSQEKH